MHLHSDICVVGNGAVGKAAALGLAQAGYGVTLLSPPERAAPVAAAPAAVSPSWDARVYALNHVAQRLLASVRVWDALDAARVTPVEAMVIRGDDARHPGALDFDAYGARTDALAWIVEDSNLNQALDAALRFASNVNIVRERATGLQLEGERAVVQLQSGNSLGASLIVGADGGQSWVRGQCDIDLSYRAYGQRGVVSNFASEKPHHGVAYQWFTGAQGIVALLPLAGQRVSLVWSAPDDLADTLMQESASQLAARVVAITGGQLGQLTPLQPELVRAFPLTLLCPHAMVAPRVALVGDAAHVVHPLAGQGMNLGFGDVVQLLASLEQKDAQRDCGDAQLLARYARARKEEVRLMQLTTDGLIRLFGTEIEPLRVVRNAGMSLLNKLPFLKRQLIAHALGR